MWHWAFYCMEGRIGQPNPTDIMGFSLVCLSMLWYRLFDLYGGSRKKIKTRKVHNPALFLVAYAVFLSVSIKELVFRWGKDQILL